MPTDPSQDDRDKAILALTQQRTDQLESQAAIPGKQGSNEEKNLAAADIQANISYLDQRIDDIQAHGAFSPPSHEDIAALHAASTAVADAVANAALVSEVVAAATESMNAYNSEA